MNFEQKQRPRSVSQKQCIERSGLTQSQVSRIESGAIIPRIDTYIKYLHGCGLDIRIVKPHNKTK